MIKKCWVLAGVLMVTACTDPSTGIKSDEDIRCLQGVQYYDGYNTLAPVFKPDGTVATCYNYQLNNQENK